MMSLLSSVMVVRSSSSFLRVAREGILLRTFIRLDNIFTATPFLILGAKSSKSVGYWESSNIYRQRQSNGVMSNCLTNFMLSLSTIFFPCNSTILVHDSIILLMYTKLDGYVLITNFMNESYISSNFLKSEVPCSSIILSDAFLNSPNTSNSLNIL